MDEIKTNQMSAEEMLMHYGRKGMKWGQHIYGKKKGGNGGDGTNKGKTEQPPKPKKKYSAPEAKLPKDMTTQELNDQIKKKRAVDDYNETFNPDTTSKKLGAASAASKATSEGLGSASKAASNIANLAGADKKAIKEMSKMSDTELRNKVNRLNMERQYADLNPSKTARGAAKASSVLSVIGNIAAVAGSAATVALLVRSLRSK